MERLFCPICAVNRGHESGVQKVRVSVCERQRELGAQALRRELGAQALRRELGAAACRRRRMERNICPLCAVNRGHGSRVQKVRVSVCERQRELGAQALRRN